jgi:hypothetical protein
MREATRKALAVLRYEANERMENSQYRHFLSRAKGEEAVVLPTEDRDRIVCFTNQVKLTCALVKIWMKLSGKSSCWESMRKNQARRSQSWNPYARG